MLGFKVAIEIIHSSNFCYLSLFFGLFPVPIIIMKKDAPLENLKFFFLNLYSPLITSLSLLMGQPCVV